MKRIDYGIIFGLVAFSTMAFISGGVFSSSAFSDEDSKAYNDGFQHGYRVGTSIGRYIVSKCQQTEYPAMVSVNGEDGTAHQFFCFTPKNHSKYGEM